MRVRCRLLHTPARESSRCMKMWQVYTRCESTISRENLLTSREFWVVDTEFKNQFRDIWNICSLTPPPHDSTCLLFFGTRFSNKIVNKSKHTGSTLLLIDYTTYHYFPSLQSPICTISYHFILFIACVRKLRPLFNVVDVAVFVVIVVVVVVVVVAVFHSNWFWYLRRSNICMQR